MFGNRSFLLLGAAGAADIVSLLKGGHEILDCNFSFEQGIDDKGKATTKVYGGTMNITLSNLPSMDILQWGMKSRKYSDGTIVVVDNENIPLEKILFKNGICVGLEIDYTQQGNSYASTKLVVQAEKVIVGNGIDFENEWTI